MELEIKVDSGLRKIKCNDYGDFITINVSDATVFTRFSGIIDNLTHISSDIHDEIVKLQEEIKDTNSAEYVIAGSKINVIYIERIISELNKVFGENAVHKILRDAYENDELYIPTEDVLVSIVEGMIPIMEQLFKKHYDSVKSRYGTSYKGKNTK